MSKEKQFEYIENKIKQAAENSQPVCDELAWQKMEALLDGKKKRRFLFWWWLLPLLMAGSWGIYKAIQPNKTTIATEETTTATDKQQQEKITANNQSTTATPDDKNARIAITTENEPGNTKIPANTPVQSTGEKQTTTAINQQKIATDVERTNPGISTKTRKKKAVAKDVASGDNATGNDDLSTNKTAPSKKIKGKSKAKTTATASAADIDTFTADENATTKNDIVDQTVAQQTVADKSFKVADEIKSDTAKNIAIEQKKIVKDSNTTATKKSDAKKEKGHGNGFYLVAVVGCDAAGVKFLSFANSRVVPKYGIGAGYQISKEWSVQTGLYVSNKKYSAGPNDYHPKKGSYWYNVKIDEVDAACLVYEIPVTVRYNFIQKNGLTFYGTVSASSYIMKKEDCDYRYTRYNVPYETSWVYTGNKHWFSQFSFSVGIEKQLTSKWSLLAEPSFSLPMTGVGDGRVSLYSTSLQVGARYFPFHKK